MSSKLAASLEKEELSFDEFCRAAAHMTQMRDERHNVSIFLLGYVAMREKQDRDFGNHSGNHSKPSKEKRKKDKATIHKRNLSFCKPS